MHPQSFSFLGEGWGSHLTVKQQNAETRVGKQNDAGYLGIWQNGGKPILTVKMDKNSIY